jgi:hypothetical protein
LEKKKVSILKNRWAAKFKGKHQKDIRRKEVSFSCFFLQYTLAPYNSNLRYKIKILLQHFINSLTQIHCVTKTKADTRFASRSFWYRRIDDIFAVKTRVSFTSNNKVYLVSGNQ